MLSALSGIVGVIMLIMSFSINPGPPSNATSAQLTAFGNQYYTSILWGAWLQAVGPLLIVLFAFAIVCLAGATTRLAGWMTLFGGTILMMVSLVEITFYMSALYSNPATMGLISRILFMRSSTSTSSWQRQPSSCRWESSFSAHVCSHGCSGTWHSYWEPPLRS